MLAFAKAHSVANTAFFAVQNLPMRPEKAVWQEWTELANKSLVRDTTQLFELEQILSECEARGIAILPLKGSQLKPLYPRTDYRSMSDLDFLIEPDKTKDMRALMTSLGYWVEKYEQGGHDVYMKEPVMNVEVHTELIPAIHTEAHRFFLDIWSRVQLCEGSQFHYRMTDEDFFVFFIAHLAKHYAGGGTGIRSFLDIHVFLKAKKATLQWERVHVSLQAIHLDDFCAHAMRLADIWFGDAPRTPLSDEMEAYVFANGTYGTILNYTTNQIIRQQGASQSTLLGRIRQFRRLIFPGYAMMTRSCPYVKRFPLLLPFAWIHRMFRVLILRRNKIQRLTNIGKVQTDQLERIRRLHEQTGIREERTS